MSYTLIHGDCLDKMSQIEDGSIDMILADLPYGTTACKWDTIIPFEPLWAHYKRVIKKRGAVVLFGSEPFNYVLYNSCPDLYRYEWVWEKDRPTRYMDAQIRPLKSHEYVMVFGENLPNYIPQKTSGHKPINTPGRNAKPAQVYERTFIGDGGSTERFPRSVQKFNVPNHGEMGLHPTQKPVTLLSYLIKTYTNEGELVLDNTMGSGSTGEACLRTGRRFIGIEKDEGYYQISVDRLAKVARELSNQDLPIFAGAL